MDNLKRIIGNRIRVYRKLKGLTQMELAEKIGYTSTASISEVERGNKALSMDKLELVAKVLEVPVSLLVTPLHYDDDVRKSALLADLVLMFEHIKDTPVIDILHTIVKSELKKIK